MNNVKCTFFFKICFPTCINKPSFKRKYSTKGTKEDQTNNFLKNLYKVLSFFLVCVCKWYSHKMTDNLLVYKNWKT